ncbi:MAG TPA: bifunctional 4-hydroxy-2-oxoglutarate aldolase/2-dehydro-3-deoxy-phosphogluconate aldolase, partial [Armatimonadetes bacterium]|nr:bifunctional 4-hydroxy-2-oxoglutarate aldolase/2-dehydro-3-deoxy-phosphogluconate aldolase [Armatimonadota bacterium]
GALRVLEELAAAYGDEIALGAGTVLDAETARACILAGAEFIVSPITDDRVIEVCKRYSKIVCPGALTPTEVVHAWERGADIVKIFPCDNVGGPAYIKALKGPLPQVEMMPTGGVTVDTAGEFIKAGATVVAAGSALVKGEWVKEGNYEAITANAQRFIEAVRTARAAG